MPKIKMICPYCGSDDVTRDALARWSVAEQTWEISSELDGMQCEACDREIGPDGFATAPVEADTRDIGLAVRDFLEGRTLSIRRDNEDGGMLDPGRRRRPRRDRRLRSEQPDRRAGQRTALHPARHRRRLTGGTSWPSN